jgi:hypothetical protein
MQRWQPLTGAAQEEGVSKLKNDICQAFSNNFPLAI